jgi:hypothetical protein
MRTFRSISLVAALMIVVIILAPGHAEGRAVYVGSLEIHAHICPSGARTVVAECSRNRAPMGMEIALDDTVAIVMDGDGSASFDALQAGDHLVTVRTSSPYAERFDGMRVFCSHSETGLYQREAALLPSDSPQFLISVAPRSRLSCDLYFIP